MRSLERLLAAVTVMLAVTALAEAPRDRFSAGGYFRIMTRPDFQGGSGQLGFYNLYGRLLNEGPYAALELRLDVLQAKPGSNDVWAAVHSRIEGGSVQNAHPGGGNLNNFRLSQLYVKSGNVLLENVTWQLGTLEYVFGDLGLYDFRPASLLTDTVGVSARYQKGRVDAVFALGDSGFNLRQASGYNTVLTAAALGRFRLNDHAELGFGGQYGFEPAVPGSRFSPYDTPNITYEDVVRREVVKRFLEENPDELELFPDPVSRSASSFRLVGYFGFGGFGPLRWSGLHAAFYKRHPDHSYVENFQGRDFRIYLTGLTDERYALEVGNEMQLRLIENRLDAVWSVFATKRINRDNEVAPGEDNFLALSTVARLQLYLTPTVHVLVEGSAAREHAEVGNLYREHVDSVFRNSDGLPDTRGLEFGDADMRHTFQGKGGLVLNPNGYGIFTRPSLRMLYGIQYSSQQAAYGNGFVESLDQFNEFVGPERHYHHVVAVEAEGWF